MPRKGLRFKDGDRFEPWILNAILQEQDRWRGLTGSGMVHVDGADGESSPTIVDYRTSTGLIPAQLTSGIAAGSIAAPATAAGTLLVPSGTGGGFTTTGGLAVTIYNIYATAVTGSNKTCWLTYTNGLYYLVVADC
jgi:hypothetical protein